VLNRDGKCRCSPDYEAFFFIVRCGSDRQVQVITQQTKSITRFSMVFERFFSVSHCRIYVNDFALCDAHLMKSQNERHKRAWNLSEKWRLCK
jgi:hypothetical protein